VSNVGRNRQRFAAVFFNVGTGSCQAILPTGEKPDTRSPTRKRPRRGATNAGGGPRNYHDFIACMV
jgi:hypothetical protein